MSKPLHLYSYYVISVCTYKWRGQQAISSHQNQFLAQIPSTIFFLLWKSSICYLWGLIFTWFLTGPKISQEQPDSSCRLHERKSPCVSPKSLFLPPSFWQIPSPSFLPSFYYPWNQCTFQHTPNLWGVPRDWGRGKGSNLLLLLLHPQLTSSQRDTWIIRTVKCKH